MMKNLPITVVLDAANKQALCLAIKHAGSINQVVISPAIKRGDNFDIKFGDGHYVPEQQSTGIWLADNANPKGLVKNVITSLMQSNVFKGESVDSEEFYEAVATKLMRCSCKSPRVLNVKDVSTREVVAVDLRSPKFSRHFSRYIVFLSECTTCRRSVTHGTGIGSFNLTGEEKIKELAIGIAGVKIDFDNIITTLDEPS